MKEKKRKNKPVTSGFRVLHELTTCLSISSIETSCKTGHPFCRSRNFYTIAHELSSDDWCLCMYCKCNTIHFGRFCWSFFFFNFAICIYESLTLVSVDRPTHLFSASVYFHALADTASYLSNVYNP